MPFHRHFVLGASLALLAGGCSTTSTSNTARTATEQLLISNAIDQSLDKIDFMAFAGHNVFIEEKYLEGVDKAYLLSSLRHRIAYYGGKVVTAADQSELVLEVRSGGIGTDNTETFYGLPEIVLPGMLTLPEMKLATRGSQKGAAKIGLVAYDSRTRQILGHGGTTLAVADANNWSVLGIGPFKSGTVREEIDASTNGDSYNPQTGLPHSVAFGSPLPATPEPDRIRLTGGQNARP